MSITHCSCLRGRLAVLIFCLVPTLVCGSAIAFSVHGRQIAATHSGEPNNPRPLWETQIATNGELAIAVYHAGTQGTKRITYAVATYDPNEPNEPWAWDSDEMRIEQADYSLAYDPSIVYDPTSGKFAVVAGAKNTVEQKNHIVVAFYDPDDPNQAFTEWEKVADAGDKPWLLAGEKTTWGRELYIVWWDDDQGHYRYARSVKGGDAGRNDRRRALVPPQHATPTEDCQKLLPSRIRPLRGRAEMFNVYCSR
jgi:hypothetical protein